MTTIMQTTNKHKITRSARSAVPHGPMSIGMPVAELWLIFSSETAPQTPEPRMKT